MTFVIRSLHYLSIGNTVLHLTNSNPEERYESRGEACPERSRMDAVLGEGMEVDFIIYFPALLDFFIFVYITYRSSII